MTLYIRWFALATLVAGSLSASVPDHGTGATDRNLMFSPLPGFLPQKPFDEIMLTDAGYTDLHAKDIHTSTSATECAGKAATTQATTYAISAIQGDFATETGDSEYCSLKGGMAYPSAKAGEYVSISGVVTAVGTQKDAYASAYYYMQMTDGTTAFAGIEVFAEDHKHMRGDELTVKGVVREVYGVTELVECFATKTGSAATLPAPIELSTDDFQGCTEHAEQYEGMLVSLGAVEVQPCQNPLTEALIAAGGKGGFYCQANLENLAWGQVFDKYKQMWVLSTGASGLPMEVDNHAVELAVEYVCATGPRTYATWINVIGVVTYAYGTWDLIPRDKFDVAGGESKTPASVGAAALHASD